MKQQLKDLKTLLLLGSCLLLAACTGRTSKASGNEEAKPVITVTIEPQRYFTEAIAGDKFTVVSMVPKGSSPETHTTRFLNNWYPWETAKHTSASATSALSRPGWTG